MELVYETATEKPDNTDTLNTPPNSMEAPCYSPEYDPGPSPTGVPEYVPTYNPTVSPVSPDYYPTDPFNSPTKAGTSRVQIVSPTQNEDDSDEVNCTYELYTIDEQGRTKTPPKSPYTRPERVNRATEGTSKTPEQKKMTLEKEIIDKNNLFFLFKGV